MENSEIKPGDSVNFAEAEIGMVKVLRTTDKAFCINVDKSSYAHTSSASRWIPFSQIDVYKTLTGEKAQVVTQSGDVHYLRDLPKWLLKKIV